MKPEGIAQLAREIAAETIRLGVARRALMNVKATYPLVSDEDFRVAAAAATRLLEDDPTGANIDFATFFEINQRTRHLIARALHCSITFSALDAPETRSLSDEAGMRELLEMLDPDAVAKWGALPPANVAGVLWSRVGEGGGRQ